MKNIKIFSHLDLDGVGCIFVTKAMYMYSNLHYTYCNYDNVDNLVTQFIKSGGIHNYDKVYITDISVKHKTAELLNKYSSKVMLIDHHINSVTDHLDKYNWVIRKGEVDNIARSGTWLVANHFNLFNKYEYIDDIVTHIDNYDCWKWKNEGDIIAKDMNDIMEIIGREQFLETLEKQFNFGLGKKSFEFTPSFLYLLEIRRNEYNTTLKNSIKHMEIVKWKNYRVGVVFCNKFRSELGNDLCIEFENEVDFIALINLSSGISLRGIKDNIHLGEIAKDIAKNIGLSGGGHKKAAAITFTDSYRNTFIQNIFK